VREHDRGRVGWGEVGVEGADREHGDPAADDLGGM
jgi:hypothetical protein